MTVSFSDGKDVATMTSLKHQSQSQAFSPVNFAGKALGTRLVEASPVN